MSKLFLSRLQAIFWLTASEMAIAGLIADSNALSLVPFDSEYESVRYYNHGFWDGDYFKTESKAVTHGVASHSGGMTGHGVLKAYAAAVATAHNGQGNARVGVGYTDFIALSKPEYNGKQGHITVAYHYDYLMAAYGTGWVSMQAVIEGALWQQGASLPNYPGKVVHSIWGDSSFYGNQFSITDDYGTRSTFDSTTGLLILSMDFIWGSNIGIGQSINVGGQVSSGAFSVDASKSAYWAGIQSVTYEGNLVTDYFLSSASGTDYSYSFVPERNTAVQEPPMLWIIVIAFVILILRENKLLWFLNLRL